MGSNHSSIQEVYAVWFGLPSGGSGQITRSAPGHALAPGDTKIIRTHFPTWPGSAEKRPMTIRLAIFSFTCDSVANYTAAMENTVVEISVALPTDLFQQAEELARKLGVSRNELYRRALSRLLAAYHETELTRQLNEIYDQEDSSLDPAVMQMQMKALKPEDW